MYVGYEGKTCRQLRQVELSTPACIEYQIYRATPFLAVEQDKWIKEMEASIEVFSKDYLKGKERELETYLMYEDFDEKDPRSYMSEETMLHLCHRFEVCQNYMERVMELKNELGSKKAQLLSLQKDASAYLFTQYTEQLRALKNESERSNFYRNAMPKLSRALDEIEAVLEQVVSLQTNLKDTYFSMRQTQEGALEIWKSRVQSLDIAKRAHL
jgi:hypothetical protein